MGLGVLWYTLFMKKLWFKRKLYGWGWTPSTWEGWLSILVYVGLITMLAFTVDESLSPQEGILTFVVPVILLTFALIYLAYKKGEKPRWQWGKDDDEK